jgi:LAO/AO transport system kinase
VLIETVGVGQDEIEIVSTADVSIVLLVPGTGDDLQAIKAGVMEIGDIFVVNKADRDGADLVAQAVSASLALRAYAPTEWTPPIVKTQALSGEGLDQLWSEIGRFRAWAAEHQRTRRHQRHESRLRDLLARAFLRQVDATIPAWEFERFVAAVEARETDPYSAVAEIVNRLQIAPRAQGSGLGDQRPRTLDGPGTKNGPGTKGQGPRTR